MSVSYRQDVAEACPEVRPATFGRFHENRRSASYCLWRDRRSASSSFSAALLSASPSWTETIQKKPASKGHRNQSPRSSTSAPSRARSCSPTPAPLKPRFAKKRRLPHGLQLLLLLFVAELDLFGAAGWLQSLLAAVATHGWAGCGLLLSAALKTSCHENLTQRGQRP